MRRGVVTSGDTFGTSLRDAILQALTEYVVEKVVVTPAGEGANDITIVTTQGADTVTSYLHAKPGANDVEVAEAARELVSRGR